MLNPLDALSALTKSMPMDPLSALPGNAIAGAMNAFPGNAISGAANAFPSNAINGVANAITENANLLQPHLAASQSVAPAISSGSGSPSTWGHMIQKMVMDVNSKQQDAAQKVSDVLQGGPTPVHEATIATEEASLSFELLAEMRNKVIDAYQQVMQMQV